MSLLTRKRLVLGTALIVGAVLLGVWMMRAGDTVDGVPTTETHASTDASSAPARAPGSAEQAPTASTSSSALGSFRGRVIDAVTNNPVREFEIRLFTNSTMRPTDDAPGARAFRTSDGRFEWTQLPQGDWTITATARGYQRFVLANLQVANDAGPEITLPMRPGHELRGRVYDEVSGAGIADASISFRVAGTGPYEDSFHARPRFQSGANGAFVVDGVPPGRMTLEVSAPSYASREVTLVVGNATAPLEIGLATGGTIAGRLTQADGVTAATGTVGLFDVERGFGSIIRVGERGEFSFAQLNPSRYQLSGDAQGGTVAREVTLARNQRIEGIVLAVKAGLRIRGVVTGLRADELKDATVSVQREDDTWDSGTPFPVDARGEFVVTDVRPGRVHLHASVTMGRSTTKIVDVPAGADVTVAIDFPAGLRLSGRVTQRGQPVARVLVQPRPAVSQAVFVYGATTSNEGRYVIEGLGEGEYRLSVGGYLSRPVLLSRDTVFDIDVPDAQVSGRVLEETGEVSVAGAEVTIWPVDPGAAPFQLRDSSDDYGQFALAGLERGDYTLSAYKPGYELFRQRISYGAPIDGLAIRLRREAGVEIRVHDAASRQALRQVYTIETLGKRAGMRMMLHLDDDGVAYIPGALAGSTLTFSVTGYEPAIISAWNGQPLDLQLRKTH